MGCHRAVQAGPKLSESGSLSETPPDTARRGDLEYVTSTRHVNLQVKDVGQF